jgi:hypothetical protein
MDERRTNMQGDGAHWNRFQVEDGRAHLPGTVTWSEHLEIWQLYAAKFGTDQSAERMAERGGFAFLEATELLGHAPRSWTPHGHQSATEKQTSR